MPLWVLSGVSGSGKTTLGRRLAARLGCPFVDADSFHPPTNLQKMRSGTPLSEADRAAWLDALVVGLAAIEGDAVLAFPGLKRTHRARIFGVRPDARFAFLKAKQALVEARLRDRGGFFPPELAASQFHDLEPEPGAFEVDASLPLGALDLRLLDWAKP